MREKKLTDMIEKKVMEAQQVCEGDLRSSDECKVAWDEVEEVSQAMADLRLKLDKDQDPLESFCQENPDTEECSVDSLARICAGEISSPGLTGLAGISNNTLADCGKDDPKMNEEMKDIITLFTEEINLQKSVNDDSLAHTKALIMDAKKTSSDYQKEAEKCNTGMETCEEAREKAVAALSEERKLSALWETRARENGWQD